MPSGNDQTLGKMVSICAIHTKGRMLTAKLVVMYKTHVTGQWYRSLFRQLVTKPNSFTSIENRI